MNKSSKATLALFVVTVIWGWTFVWMKEALNFSLGTAENHSEYAGEGNTMTVVSLFIALRFGIAAILMPLLMPNIRRDLKSKEVWKGGGILAGLILGGFLFQMHALKEIDPAASAFLTSLYVIFTAIIVSVLKRKIISKPLAFGVILATFGAGYIQGPPQVEFGRAEWFTVVCALIFGFHIIATDKITKVVPPMAVTMSSICIAAIGGVVIFLYSYSTEKTATDLGFVYEQPFLVPVLLCSVLGTLMALSLVNYFQKDLDPVRAAILFALEPVWATVISISYGMTGVTVWLLAGGGALLVGNLISELNTDEIVSDKIT